MKLAVSVILYSPCVSSNARSATSFTPSAKHHFQLVATSFEAKSQPRSFVPQMNNDVLASLEMMLTLGQMMLCLTAQIKKSNTYELDFLCLATEIDDILIIEQFFQHTLFVEQKSFCDLVTEGVFVVAR